MGNIIHIPVSSKELSQRKLSEYEKLSKIINWGRQNPVKFIEEVFGIVLIDFQKYAIMESWWRPFVLWLMCRGAGKDTNASIMEMAKMLLIPNYHIFVSCNSAQQSADSFKKLEDIAMRRIPSLKSTTEIFAREVETSPTNQTGFSHDKSGHSFRLYNNSQMVSLSSNLETVRGKRGSVWFNETAWKTAEDLAVVENFINVDSNFSTSVDKQSRYDPIQMPLQLLYTSSAGDVEYPFFQKYKAFAKKMIAGDSNYFVADIDAFDVLHHSTINGISIKAHLTNEQINKAVEEDPELAERELFNRFRRGVGKNAVVTMDNIIRNSVARKPLLMNDTGKKKFLFLYDPARAFDGSILMICQIMDDPNIGYWLQLENVISMVDVETTKKTPLPMPRQIEIIREQMILYNGERAADWENITFYIDAGAGGGGVSAVADQLMQDWTDATGRVRRGIIDPDHKQYETARRNYPNAAPIIHLLDPAAYKKIIYDALEKMSGLNLIKYTDYDGNKDYLLIDDGTGKFNMETLTFSEKMALTQINLTKNEVIYMCRYDTPNGGVQYELARDKKNTMHDDRSYCLAMAAFGLAMLRRADIVENPRSNISSNVGDYCLARAPVLTKNRW